ncbi:MAG: FHA domain-containing protein [Planctomycetota bacterium]|nr:MAG: FHA domain-containing protein [Planctomycetota bacterium]
MAYLTPSSGSQFGKRIELTRPVTVMGRHPQCDIVLDAGPVSRQHARIRAVGEDQFVLEDLNSRNGTFLNGQKLKEATILRDGDMITICDFEYLFHSETDSGPIERFTTHLAPGSSFGVIMVDDGGAQESSRSVERKLDLRASSSGTALTTSAETRLEAVLSIARNLGGTIELDKVLPKLLDTLFTIFLQADRAFIVLQEGDQLVPKWIKTRKGIPDEEFQVSRTIIREVMDSKHAIISLDAATDSRFDSAMSIADFGIRSIIVAPLLSSSGEALGVLQMDTKDAKRKFTPDDLEVLAGIATQAGIAIENARLHERIVAQQRVEQDLKLARSVQEAFLPHKSPEVPGWRFFNYYRPAEHIGGDYFDYIPLSNGKIAVVVADVAGHGVAAAMLMAKLSAEARFLLASHPKAAEAITLLNQRLAELSVEKFVTLVCLVIDPETGACELVNAAHMLPIWVHQDGRITEPGEQESGIPLGIMRDYPYESVSLQLEVGDRIVLYTDGINEAVNPAGEMFGIPRLKEVLKKSIGPLPELGARIMQQHSMFCGRAPQGDDICLVLVERSPPEA